MSFRRLLTSLAAGLPLAGLAVASAQTIYTPVHHQYRAPNGGGVFFYGGSDPFVFAMATRLSVDPGFGRVAGFAFVSSTRSVRVARAPVYSDAVPGVDLAPFGYTIDDAYNAAQRSIPTYFRMAELRRQAVVQPDGSRIVPARPGGPAAASHLQGLVAPYVVPGAQFPEPHGPTTGSNPRPGGSRGLILILPVRPAPGPTLPQASHTPTSGAATAAEN